MKSARGSFSFLGLLAGIAIGVHAEEPSNRTTTTKPASSATSAAKPAADAAKSTTADDAGDDAFLEFLGSVDSDDDWLDYLARTDIREVAKAKKKAQPAAESRATPDKADK